VKLGNKEKYNILTDEYREKYFQKTIDEVNKYNGKIFLAIESENIIGIIIGVINNEEESTYDFKAPKRGRVTEFVVSKKYLLNGVGKQLLTAMETYFKEVGCIHNNENVPRMQSCRKQLIENV